MLRIKPDRMAVALAVSLAVAVTTDANAFNDPLNTPAIVSAHAAKSSLVGISVAGNQLVSVGQRGTIVVTDEQGETHLQSKVPVSSDLVAVHFPTPKSGWAVGHDGVVLRSSDGGNTWTKQLDGSSAAKLMQAYYKKEVEAGNQKAKGALAEAERFVEQGPVHPFLDVWFESERVGYVVGAFGLVFKTQDSGETWIPWFDRMDNPNGLHLYGIRGGGGQTFIVGEQGLILRLDSDKKRFVALESPYQGTYFGVLLKQNNVVAFGMRGNAYHSPDLGKTWKKVKTDVSDGLVAGAVFDDGRVVVISQGGTILFSHNNGETFDSRQTVNIGGMAGVASVKGNVVLVGSRGVATKKLK